MAELIVGGLAVGCIYALAALGFVIIHNSSGAVNFAHGHFVLLGGYLAIAVSSWDVLAAWQIPVAAALLMAPLGALFDRLAFRPLRGKPFVTVFISTLALGIIITNVILLVWGPRPQTMAPIVGGRSSFAGVAISNQAVAIILVTVLLVGLQRWLFEHTELGLHLRATAQDRKTAQLMGIATGRVATFAVILASSYAGIAGALLVPLFIFEPSFGVPLILKIYIAVVLGGFGSLSGAVMGGLLLGVGEALLSGYVSSAYMDALIFASLLAILAFRPQGIMGEAAGQRV